MLGYKNTKKKTAMSGVGIALLLCILMVGMTMTNLVQNDTVEEKVDFAEANDTSEDYFALPEVNEPVEYEQEESSELEGMRSSNQKAFLNDDGTTTLLTSADPMHYMSGQGSWENIDLNIKATVDGWEVTENLYEVAFPSEVGDGVAVMVNPYVDPIVTGIAPVVMTLDATGTAPMPYMVPPSHEGISVGGNVIRYPIAEGFDLDYTVEENQVKQNLVIREKPVLTEDIAWFGLTEQMRLPMGYGLYLGDDIIREDIVETQEELTIRNLETGEVLAYIPVPVVTEMGAEAPYHATYFVQSYGNIVIITTAVDTDWLLDDERTFPLGIDPAVKVYSGAGGYCYVYYANCYSNSYRYTYRYYSTIYYLPWQKYTFTSSNALPSGASIDKIEWQQYIRYSSGYSSNAMTAVVMEKCGTSNRYSSSIPSASCSGKFTNPAAGYGTTKSRKMISSIWNSAAAGTYSVGTGWKAATICKDATACAATTGSHTYITDALANGGQVNMGTTYTTNTRMYTYAYAAGSSNSYLSITYSGGSDTKAPTSKFVPYSGITSYKEGARTLFTTLEDSSGILTTSTGAPHLHYSMNNGSYTAVKATTIGTCGSADTSCQFSATTGDIQEGDYVKYYWAFQDLASSPNGETDPATGSDSGTSSTASAPSSTHWFFVDSPDNAGNAKKLTTLATNVHAGSYYSPNGFFDRQMTYYDNSDEYVFEFDTSRCGTGSSSCFYATSYYFYSQWEMMWTTTPGGSYNGMGGTKSGDMMMHKDDDGYLSIGVRHGPGMNLIYLYDSTMNQWAMVGLDGDSSTSGMQTGIDEVLTGGNTAAKSSTYGYTAAHRVPLNDITGTFGKFDFNGTYSSSKANWLCMGTNGYTYFFRSTSSSPRCTSSYYNIYSASYTWSGFAMGSGYYGRQATSGTMTYKIGKVAPEPDLSAPELGHTGMLDSHSRDRTVTVSIGDAGEPPVGLNVSTSVGVGPSVYYRETTADGTVGSWNSDVLSPVGATRSSCVLSQCDWSFTIEDIERGSTLEYYITAQDVQDTTGGNGPNTNTSSTYDFEVGDPNKVFVVEWHDQTYVGSYYCTYQVLMYDVTNEIEFKYDKNCKVYYDYATVGYQDQTRSKGATLQQDVGYLAGGNPYSHNYRISTSSTSHGYETFDLGMVELPTWDTAIAGSSNGYPYGYYCVSSYYWNTYKSGCNANIDMPDGFTFDYFGTEYNGSDSKNRVHIARMGNMYLKADGSTALERSMTTWYSNMPDLPYSGNSYSKAGNIAPAWSYYSSYYCYDNTAYDCSVRTRVIPFEGKGTDVTADLVNPTTWSLIDSPIRVNPSNDYLSIGANLTIEPGVVIQVGAGKGLSFDGSCDNFMAMGNSTDHILIEGQGGAEWKGLAFTGACSTAEGTDDRHQMSYIDFANTSDAAISAGSRHGATPSSNANVGNFTMDHVTFTNVGTAFKHGSGQGTVLTMSDFEINDASDSCFDLAEDSVVTLTDGDMDDCNSGGNSWGGAIVNYPGSTGGALTMENVDITDSLVNLIDIDLAAVWISNVTATSTSGQSGTVLDAAGGGTGSSLYVYNMDASGYSSASVNSMDSISMDTVDWGSANIAMAPGGTSSTAAGPYGVSATMDDVTAGDLTMTRMGPNMNNMDLGVLTIMGNAPTTVAMRGTSWTTSGISVSGCGFTITATDVTSDWLSGSCSNSAAPNTIVMEDYDATYSGNMNAVYARNSAITIGDGDITMPSSYDKMAKASTNGEIVLIEVTQDGTDCTDSSAGCDVSSSSSGAIYFGGTATVKVYKLAGDGVTKQYKADHTVQATVVDSGASLFTVGTHKTDSTGEATVWVISGNDAGDSYTYHNLAAWGPSGQNETMWNDLWAPSGFGIGDSIELRLEPAPVSLNGTNMDCDYLLNNTEAALGYDGSIADGYTNTFTWEGKVTMSGDLTIDGCNIIMKNVFAVASDATNSPTLTIPAGGTLTFVSTSTDTATLKAVSSTYPLDLDMDGGALTLDGAVMRDLAGGLHLDSGTLTVFNGSTIYGNSGASSTEATVYANGGILDWDDSTIINSGQTGIGIMFEDSLGAVDNIVVQNAEVGMYSHNAAPQVNGFTLTDNDVGVDVYGGMSLPTLYRSTLLSGQSRGWTTYAIDLSAYLGSDDYLQMGLTSVYAGGNAHPTYNYATSKYYMIYDRLNIELEDDLGNKWNVTDKSHTGYYDGSDGGAGGAPSWHCNYYGYSYTEWYDYSYFYYLIRYGGYTSSGSNNDYPSDFGFRWEDTDNTPSTYYPMMYWGYYYTAYHGGYGDMMPPEGYGLGYPTSYNVCLNYAYSYYNSPGDSARLSFPAVDVSGSNITGATMYIDVLHNRADNFQDRLEVVARTGNDPSDMGSFARESGTPLFADGTITGAEDGIEIGGEWAAGEFSNITVTSPTSTGLDVVGSVSASVDDLTVTGGNYGMVYGAGASGTLEATNLDLQSNSLAGVYLVKDVAGALSGSITGSAGPALKFASSTSKDMSWDSMTLAGNAIGIETAGTGDLTLEDSTFANTKDFLISGSSTVTYIDGTVDVDTVEVTANGLFSRQRSLDVSVTADTNAVSGTQVMLLDASGLVTGSAETDSAGDAVDLLYVTNTVDSSGKTVANLAGYKAVTVAKIGTYSYSSASSNSADFRYAFETLTLTDDSDNTATMDLVDNVDARICYSFSSTSYVYTAPCAGYLSTNGARTYTSGMKEYGYYGATPADMSGKVVMMDAPTVYLKGNGAINNYNGSTILNTGGYTSSDVARLYSISPYRGQFWMHEGEVYSLAVDNQGDAQGLQIGYYYGAYLLPNVQNSTLSGMSYFGASHGYKSYFSTTNNWEADMFTVKNNKISHFNTKNMENTGSSAYDDMCMIVSGSNVIIEGNTVTGCMVGVFLMRTPYYYYHTNSYWGADDAIIKDNHFKDTVMLDVWFYLGSNNEGTVISGNTMSGSSSPSYAVYTQDSTTTDLTIHNNTISNADEAIYMRGATDFTITDNVITGKQDASFAGIYSLNGYGVISGNTLTDADGGILVDGVKYGFDINITDNTLTQTPGRTAPAAVGIWAEDCGTSGVMTGGNDITIMENAIVTDGCDLYDTGSTLNAIGGSGGTVHSVQSNALSFSPANLTIKTGDTVRWRANEYNSGQTHNIYFNDSGDSSGNMNLGSTWTKTFYTAGTYWYYDANAPTIIGVIIVENGSSSGFTSVGFNVAGTNDEVTLDGTEISGFNSAIEQYGGDMLLTGGAVLSGGAYGAYAMDTDVIVDGAELIGGSSGSGMYITGTSTFDATDMDASGLYGLNTDGIDFRWNGGDSDAVTALMVDGGAEGSVENVTWGDTTNQIDAGAYTTVTSVGNTLDASKLIVDATAVIHEGNLLNLNATHKGADATDIGLMIKSTDSSNAAYVSPAYRSTYMTVDGDMSEWYGNTLNPSDDAMPGVMSGDGTEDFLTTWDANNMYLALTGVDMNTADLQIYIDSSTGGDTEALNWNSQSMSLPFAADYVFWAENGDDGNSGLKVNGFTGWSEVSGSCTALSSQIGDSSDTDTEISIPWDCIGSPADTVRMIVIVQDDSTGQVASVHPSQTIATGNNQSFNEEITLIMGHSDLSSSDELRNHLLIYRSYVGSNTPSTAKNYDLSVKVDAACEEDWGNIDNIDMSTNVWESVDILRACPVITDLVDVTVDEDSGEYTLVLTNLADDVQDEENTLAWTVSDDADAANSPSMLLDSSLNEQTQTMVITPDNDQFGTYIFHFDVVDSHGLSASKTITWTVKNVNDAPVICNNDRADCMPVFADDGAGNLNVLDEGFGSVSKALGSAANATGSYVNDMASNDMANEQPQTYQWGAQFKGADVTVEPYWVQKKFDSVGAMFAEAGIAVTDAGGWQQIEMSGDPSAHDDTDLVYTLPTLNNVTLLTYLLYQNGCGSVYYQEYMDSAGEKVIAVRSAEGTADCDSTIDTYGNVYSGLNYTDFWMTAYGVDTSAFDDSWDDIFPEGYTTAGGYNPCPAFSISMANNELTITENTENEAGGGCTIVLSLKDDGGYCDNSVLGETNDVRAACVAYTYLIDYPNPYAPGTTITGCYNVFIGFASFNPYTPEATCLAYSWVEENTDATAFEVDFHVTPVNDAPVVQDWDRETGVVISDGNGDVPNFPWKVTLTEDDEDTDNLTYDLSAMKDDDDHTDDQLVWSIAKAETCDYENYFSATITDDEISFDLIKDATTNAPEWEVDYLNDGGIHQANPLSGEFCPITLYLHDTPEAPPQYPNYDMSTANYQQGEDSVTLFVRVMNVAENVPDYFVKESYGFNFNGVTNIMPGTYVPTTVKVGHSGDEGPYNYDHMLQVTFHSNGYNNDDPTAPEYITLGTQYITPPAYGEEIPVNDMIYISGSTTTKVWVEIDVLTCVDTECDTSKAPEDRFFGHDFPEAHRCLDSNSVQGEAWSCPGEIGESSVDAEGNSVSVTMKNNRRPMLEDQNWCNNIMTSEAVGADCAQPRTNGLTTTGSNSTLPTVVRLIGSSSVPSFAPSLITISAAGLFVSALVLQSRRDEEEEELEEMTIEDDDAAVSPVIATILMVAITVVLSGVIYVWASSLADTSAKGVPRLTFDLDSSQSVGTDNPHHEIQVTSNQVELATQAISVRVQWEDSSGIQNEVYNLADTLVYGFSYENSQGMVTFADSVDMENGATKSSFNTGDVIMIRSTNAAGEDITDMSITISYVPDGNLPGSVLRTWSGI